MDLIPPLVVGILIAFGLYRFKDEDNNIDLDELSKFKERVESKHH